MDCPINAVKARMFYARNKLRAPLSKLLLAAIVTNLPLIPPQRPSTDWE
jgi:hypothetical protein